MAVVSLILLILAFVLFLLAGWGVSPPAPRNLVAFGLACWVLSVILGSVGSLH